MSDDGLELRESDTGLLALPNRPSIRLWQDSQAAMLPEVVAAEPATKLTLTTLPLRAAHMAWVSCSFLCDVHGKDAIRAQFHHVVRIVQTTHCYQLDYPREYALLPDVEAAVLAVVAEETTSTYTVRSGA